jgi:hypothetical protein
MLVFDCAELTQDATKILDAALTDEVIINSKDGNSYKLLPVKKNKTNKNKKTGKSPLENIPCIKLDITTQEIVELLRESRAGI